MAIQSFDRLEPEFYDRICFEMRKIKLSESVFLSLQGVAGPHPWTDPVTGSAVPVVRMSTSDSWTRNGRTFIESSNSPTLILCANRTNFSDCDLLLELCWTLGPGVCAFGCKHERSRQSSRSVIQYLDSISITSASVRLIKTIMYRVSFCAFFIIGWKYTCSRTRIYRTRSYRIIGYIG